MEISRIRSISTSITNKAGALAKDSDIFCILASLRDYIAHWLVSMLESFYISGRGYRATLHQSIWFMGLRQTVQCELRASATIHVYTRMESLEFQRVETSRDFVDFLFVVHLFSSIYSFLCSHPIGAMLNVLLTCPLCCMAPVLRSRCLLRLVLI